MKSISGQFKDWVSSKDPNETYDFIRGDNCAFCQFLKDQGIAKTPTVILEMWYDGMHDSRHPIPADLVNVLGKHPAKYYYDCRDSSEINTFGELAARLELVNA